MEPGPILKKRIWWDWGKNVEKNTIWDGWYTNGDDPEKYAQQLRNFQIAFLDYNITGTGEDHNGKYKVEGKFTLDVLVVGKSEPQTPSGSQKGGIKNIGFSSVKDPELKEVANVRFTLTYLNGKVCTYVGELLENSVMWGTWEMSGKNSIEKKTGEFMLSQAGHHFKLDLDEKGQNTTMDQKLSITTHGIFGVGKDEIGPWVIRGDLNLTSRTVVMAKNYLKKQSLIMNGRWNIHKGDIILRGVYDLRDLANKKIVVPNKGGTWELRGKFGQCKPMTARKEALPYEEWKDKMLDLEEFVDFSEGFQMPNNIQSAGLKPSGRGAALGRSDTTKGRVGTKAPIGRERSKTKRY